MITRKKSDKLPDGAKLWFVKTPEPGGDDGWTEDQYFWVRNVEKYDATSVSFPHGELMFVSMPVNPNVVIGGLFLTLRQARVYFIGELGGHVARHGWK